MAKGPTFTVADIPVTVDPSFFLVIGLFGLAAPGIGALALWVGIATVSVVVHELGHAVAFRVYGSPASIRLHGMGGLTIGTRLPPRQNLVVSLAGPLAGLVLLGVPAVLIAFSNMGDEGPLWELALTYAIFINVLWSLINLLPVLPLDGGNVLQSLLHLATGRDAERSTRLVSIGVAGAGCLAGMAFGYPVVGLMAAFAVAINVTALAQQRDSIRSVTVRAARQALLAGDAWEAVQQAEAAVGSSRSATDRAAAVDVQAWAWLLAGDLANAMLALSRRPQGEAMSPALQGAIALASQHVQQGLGLMAFALVDDTAESERVLAVRAVRRCGLTAALGDELFQMHDPRAVDAAATVAAVLHRDGAFVESAGFATRLAADPRFEAGVWAYNAASSLTRAGRLDDALGWLQVAIDAGWSDLGRLDADPDLAALRSRPEFWVARNRLVAVT